jgi:SAM-dependent methyltransferase
MTDTANASQFEAWNGDSGHRWVARADERDRVLAPVGDALLRVAAPTRGTRVLDIGCGCGATTLMAAADVGATGLATGIDLSAPMLDVARQRVDVAGATSAMFVQGDVQTHVFEPGVFDLVISRFGTMFFSKPEAAFTNVCSALRPGGRLCVATWQPLVANEWLTVPGAALLQHTDMPVTGSDEPGMFAQSDPDRVRAVLDAAGFVDTNIEADEVTLTLGQTVDEAVEHLADSGPGRVMLETLPAGPARDAAIADVRAALGPHLADAGVQLGGGILLTTATRPQASSPDRASVPFADPVRPRR